MATRPWHSRLRDCPAPPQQAAAAPRSAKGAGQPQQTACRRGPRHAARHQRRPWTARTRRRSRAAWRGGGGGRGARISPPPPARLGGRSAAHRSRTDARQTQRPARTARQAACRAGRAHAGGGYTTATELRRSVTEHAGGEVQAEWAHGQTHGQSSGGGWTACSLAHLAA